jgi:hypothetical protein
MTLAADPAVWVALGALIAMEVVLGIDNLIFISILTNRLAAEQQKNARPASASVLALMLRLILLATISFIVQLTAPVFTLRSRLLLARPDPDRRRPVPGLEGDQGNPPHGRSRGSDKFDMSAAPSTFDRRRDRPDPAARPGFLDRFHHHRRRHDRRDRHHVHRRHLSP